MCEKEGSLRPVIYREGHFTAIADDDEQPGTRMVFELVSLDDGRIGLRANGHFLSAVIHNGDLTLSAKICSSWENFVLWDPAPSRRGTECGTFARQTPSLSISCLFAYREPHDVSSAVRAIESTLQCIRADCLYWFSNVRYPSTIPGLDIVNISVPGLVDFQNDTSIVYLRLLPRVITTDFTLVVQPDGFSVNPMAWDDNFWKYDYIGAVWPTMWGGGPHWGGPIVGNGGFSLRSRRLCNALLDLRATWRVEDWGDDQRLNFPRDHFWFGPEGKKYIPEDVLISIWYRKILENSYGISFCPPELANKFSVEVIDPFTQYWVGRSFGFHGPSIARHYGVEL